jgi:transporter family protein
MNLPAPWVLWALLSAFFAALTAIFAKVGLQDVNPDFATLVRTAVILIVLLGFVSAVGKWQDPAQISGRAWSFLVLSALATGASWICYFRALKVGEAFQVAPLDKLSVVLVIVFAYLFLGERPAGKDWLGAMLVAAGALLLALKR